MDRPSGEVPVLTAGDVQRSLPMSAAIEAMREAFVQLADGAVTMPTRLRLAAPADHGLALVMACHSKAEKLYSVKVATIYPHNPQHGRPTVQSTLILIDGVTGSTIAVIDGASLTAIRTGAASGLATDLLAPADAAIVAIVGAGIQARTQLEAVCCVRSIREARVYSRTLSQSQRFAEEMSAKLGVSVVAVESSKAALQDAAIVCTATPSLAAVFSDSELAPNVHINAVGAFTPDMVEIPAATVARARVVVDHADSAREEAGDLLAAQRDGLVSDSVFSTQLGDLLTRGSDTRSFGSCGKVSLFKSVGIAIQDLCAARVLWRYISRNA